MNLDTILKSTSKELENLAAGDGESFNGIREHTESAFKNLLAAMFPAHMNPEKISVLENLNLACENLKHSITRITGNHDESSKIINELIAKLPSIRKILMTDIISAYQGDPAAKSLDEIILSYPAFIAISAYRIAHELYLMRVNLIARIITEYAHKLTGIDIHPGAKIGEYFFIDHGTGVVIGETATIGKHVKLYQHVTIGAKSFAVSEDGSLVKDIKRHPDIGDNVIIYAGATILGGDTRIGDNCVIGGNVWLTHSVKAGEVVLNER
ncbi:MAG: hypothetical protein IJS99_08525 [Synergistaceae bacterium]|nr:hypothetical protein [Synergistaceae bacterium]